jgi:hypothetical protein
MGKRNFAGTLTSDEHRTDASKYANDLTVWIRGWQYGIEVTAKQIDGEDEFEIRTTGGSSTGRSNGRLIGRLTNQGFVRAN